MARSAITTVVLTALTVTCLVGEVLAQPKLGPPEISIPPAPVAWQPPTLRGNALPINLPTALKLVNARTIDIAIASQRIQQANAQFDQAKYAWLPTITIGADYLRHDGRFQEAGGGIINPSRSSFMAGAGVNAIFTPSDAIFAPLATRQVVRSRLADRDTIEMNTMLTVAEAYFSVQQARGEYVGALTAVKHAEELVRRTEKLAEGLIAPVEAVRARTDLAIRKQAAFAAQERWDVASADLIRVLRLDPAALIDPVEPPHLRVTLIGRDETVDTLIPTGLRNRPELASQQALIEATLQRLRQEKIRPLIPSLVLKGSGTNPPASFSGGVFGGGNDALNRYGPRADVELQVYWELQGFGLVNRAKVHERRAEHQLAMLELFRLQDRIAAEVFQAHAQAKSAADRLTHAESGLKDAADSVDKNFQGLSQTRRAGDLIILMVRPQEVIAAVQSLSQAYSNYYGAVADYNRAQFRLYRALGYPAAYLAGNEAVCAPR
ncbi:MAG: TolC family protein [Planctomycetes bacterium]|nr:TolC family protein [Planctomycetota bacterium]